MALGGGTAVGGDGRVGGGVLKGEGGRELAIDGARESYPRIQILDNVV